jgi:signal transduction histidine kinase
MFIVAYVIGLRALAPVDHARRRQAEFVADASHELRTPLSVIEAEVEISLARQRSAGEYRSTLQRVGEEGRRLQYIVEDLLWLARHDEKVPKVDNAVLCDVASAAKSCVARFQGLATMNDISLTQTIDVTTNSFVHADPESIDRLLGVLVDNACKFAGSGGRVEVVVSSYPGRVILKVGDSGPGIEAAEQVAIFERFHHSDSTNGGTGLGLAIADSIITASDAQRRVGTSHLGGAEFEIVWPAEDF